MKGRLFLRLDDALIERARQYAWTTGQSLSTVVETYFASLPESIAGDLDPYGSRRRHASSAVAESDGTAVDDTSEPASRS